LIGLTPTKSTKVCCVCGENKKEVHSIESEKGKERKLSQLLLEYGDLNQYLCKNVLILFHDLYRKINFLPLKYSFV
jgi:hypothetical protein